MRTHDFDTLLRSTVGFDRFGRLFDQVQRVKNDGSGYPPYNIEKSTEDNYRISMAVAGFAEADLDVTVTDNTLVVKGGQNAEVEGVSYLHRGIAGRAFERRFELAESIKVTGAGIENGMLNIDLVREVPEHKKPRKISVLNKSEPAPALQDQAA
jgi:molecular chaperone IbpA